MREYWEKLSKKEEKNNRVIMWYFEKKQKLNKICKEWMERKKLN